jgi:hypothetical protein
MGNDGIARIKARLTKIALRDTAMVLEQDRAVRRMADLGLTSEQVIAMVQGDPPVMEADYEGAPLATSSYFGFKDRRQAMMAAFAGMPKQQRPAGIADAADRVNTLIKNQVPERATATIGISIVSLPAMVAITDGPVKRMRRLPSGKLRELGSVIDVEAEELEPSSR